MALTVRRATSDDAAALSALSARCFTETFGHLYRPEDLSAFLRDAYAEAKQLELLSRGDSASWLLEDVGVPVGYVVAGPSGLPHADVKPGDGELKRLYLLKAYQCDGQGSRLMQSAMDWLLRDGPRTLWVGVWSENHGAQRFYERLGFRKVGDYLFPVGEARDLEFILHRPAVHVD